MVEEVLFETEQRMERGDIAAMFRQIAESLESGAPIALSAGEQSIELEVPQRPTFEVKAEREGQNELSVEFELEWREGEGEDTALSIG